MREYYTFKSPVQPEHYIHWRIVKDYCTFILSNILIHYSFSTLSPFLKIVTPESKHMFSGCRNSTVQIWQRTCKSTYMKVLWLRRSDLVQKHIYPFSLKPEAWSTKHLRGGSVSLSVLSCSKLPNLKFIINKCFRMQLYCFVDKKWY